MKLIKVLMALMPTIPLVSSLPSNTVARGLPGAVYTCSKSGFAGECKWTPPTNECRTFFNVGDNAPNSVGPDAGGVCSIYTGLACAGVPIRAIYFPGIAQDLPRFGSMKCHAL
ncbi:hypothetical protein EJ04DRAFT_568005 [Polyplosphaeria fusca]|uniref:Uncharacterized protein n=1 Tax=Polyplosphaeria fusca TaxID=682080 RepID=A0A9P4UZE0_9PLEO|nr:hypothetical protein EJ04DRAFT_568005 [Polyplosphaeria fusca]